MYLLAEFASEQAFAGLGLSDAKNNNVIDQFNLGIAPSYNDIFNVDWQNYYKLYSVVISSLFRKIISTGQGTSRHKDE